MSYAAPPGRHYAAAAPACHATLRHTLRFTADADAAASPRSCRHWTSSPSAMRLLISPMSAATLRQYLRGCHAAIRQPMTIPRFLDVPAASSFTPPVLPILFPCPRHSSSRCARFRALMLARLSVARAGATALRCHAAANSARY